MKLSKQKKDKIISIQDQKCDSLSLSRINTHKHTHTHSLSFSIDQSQNLNTLKHISAPYHLTHLKSRLALSITFCFTKKNQRSKQPKVRKVN